MKEIYRTLKKLRKQNGYTQGDIADYLNLDPSSISNLELGKVDISLSKLELLSQKYNMTVIELLAYPNSVTIHDETSKLVQVEQKLKEVIEFIKG